MTQAASGRKRGEPLAQTAPGSARGGSRLEARACFGLT
jgi:hypothetical protein